MSASGLPGNRVEAYRAGMTATMSSGGTESTLDPVDAGRTTNNSTRPFFDVLGSRQRYGPSSVEPFVMNTKRVAWLVVGAGAVAVWLAGAATTGVRPPQVVVTPKPAALDLQGEALAAEIARLHDRLRPSAAPVQSRDLFRYANRAAAKPGASAQTAAPPLPPIDRAPMPTLKLLGIAEDAGTDGTARTAIVSDAGTLVFVKEGEAVSHFRVTRIAPDVVEFTDVDDHTVFRLALK